MAANPAIQTKHMATPQPSETYQAMMDVAWKFDYQSGVAKLDDLYKRAKDKEWNADDLKWVT